ncbi:hypothetical protein D3C86_2188220 [compost metagenome]
MALQSEHQATQQKRRAHYDSERGPLRRYSPSTFNLALSIRWVKQIARRGLSLRPVLQA